VTRVPPDGPVVVSACLAGVACTYEAQPKTREWAVRLAAEGRAVLVCPEVAGGLGIPRPEAEIHDGDGADVLDGTARVVNVRGEDVTTHYLAGARTALDAARRSGATLAVLKARSPSCGCGRIYDGTHSGTQRDGDGVTAAMLKRASMDVCNDEEIDA
jgi:uncharacterized protein YbbK (DUF523 family)